MEALWPTTGPAKNLIDFARRASDPSRNGPRAIVTVATYHRGGGPPSNDFVRACEKAGLEVHVICERFLFDPAILPAIRQLAACCNPDIVQSHAVKSHFLIRLTALHKNRPWIAFHHGYTWTSQRTKLYNYLDRWSLLNADKVLTVCRPFADNLKEIGVPPERIVVQHNSVKSFSPSDPRVVSELRSRFGISEADQIVLCAGRLSREKAQADLIDAVAFLRERNPQICARFVIAGDGPDRQMLVDKAKSLGVDDLRIQRALPTYSWKPWPRNFRSSQRKLGGCRRS
jgi:glycosyltransferase involved in cell wall biosynthesis